MKLERKNTHTQNHKRAPGTQHSTEQNRKRGRDRLPRNKAPIAGLFFSLLNEKIEIERERKRDSQQMFTCSGRGRNGRITCFIRLKDEM